MKDIMLGNADFMLEIVHYTAFWDMAVLPSSGDQFSLY
jgi:hypothetical protein